MHPGVLPRWGWYPRAGHGLLFLFDSTRRRETIVIRVLVTRQEHAVTDEIQEHFSLALFGQEITTFSTEHFAKMKEVDDDTWRVIGIGGGRWVE